jgi:hypothetical protein
MARRRRFERVGAATKRFRKRAKRAGLRVEFFMVPGGIASGVPRGPAGRKMRCVVRGMSEETTLLKPEATGTLANGET